MAAVFVTSTGTSAGKTFVSRGLAALVRGRGLRVAALKPLETGCVPEAQDAFALARASGHPGLAGLAGLYRVAPPVSPYAATLMGEQEPDFEGIVGVVRAASAGFDWVIVEGAGGLLVPLDGSRDTADLAAALAYPLLIVAPNRLGVLSHGLALHAVAKQRALTTLAMVLTEPDSQPDASAATNARILAERTGLAVVSFPFCRDDDQELAQATESSGLGRVLGLTDR